jgi:nucleoside-diphosphate-sugar epimerase
MHSSNQLKHALVFGSSGVSGWALVNELLHDYPHHGVWGRVTALTNRPLGHGMSHWPEDKRLNIVSGIDLLKGSLQDLEEVTKTKISDVDSVTHIFYYGRYDQII